MANICLPQEKNYISITKLACSIIIIVVASSSASAQLRFANIFSDNMVLQREKPVRVWGWAEPGAEITVTISENSKIAAPYAEDERQQNDDKYSVTVEYAEQNAPPFHNRMRTVVADSNGLWQVEFDKMPGGFKPKFLVAVSGDNGVSIKNILIGEIWVCGGQSNMEWDDCMARDLEGPGAIFPGIRYTKVGETWYKPLEDLRNRARWVECSPNTLRAETSDDMAVIPFFFAQYVHRYLKVPVGIINTARGGTLGISWSSRDELNKIDANLIKDILNDYDKQTTLWEDESYGPGIIAEYEAMSSKLTAQWEKDCEIARIAGKNIPEEPEIPERPQDPRNAWSPPMGMFNASVAPIGKMAIRGILYYQGENNFFGYMPQYEHTFPAIAPAFRKAFDDPHLPFGVITLPGWGNYGQDIEFENMPGGGGYAIIRDIHTRTAEKDPDAGLITTYDYGNSWIHPWIKRPVGDRAARWALVNVYGQKLRWRGPKFSEMKKIGNEIYAWFKPDPMLSQDREEIKKMHITVAVPCTFQGSGDYTGYTIAGNDRRWFPARVQRNDEENSLTLSSPFVDEPVAIRYGWANWPTGNSTCNMGHPTPTFRTDDWPIQGPSDEKLKEQLRRKAEIQRAERKTREALSDIQEHWRDAYQDDEKIQEQFEQLERSIAAIKEKIAR